MKIETNDSPLRHCCLPCELAPLLATLKTRALMTLGPLIKFQRAVVLRFLWIRAADIQPVSFLFWIVTSPHPCQRPPLWPGPSMCCFRFSVADESIAVLLREPWEAADLDGLTALCPQSLFTAHPALLPLVWGRSSEPSCS